MLTALVVREHADLDDVVRVPARAAAISDGDVGLVTGQRVTVRKLLQLMLVASANDAAEALAIHVAGSEGAFVRMMNEKAAGLGLSHTRAVDPHGLSEREVTSAGNLAVLARNVMADGALRPMLTMRSVSVPLPGGGSRTVEATNELLGRYPGMLGVKTGYTSDAGWCFVGAAKRGDVELVGVVMGAKSKDARFAEMRRLLDWGFANVRRRTVVSADTTMASVPVTGGVTARVDVRPVKSFAAHEFKGRPMTTEVTLKQDVGAPVHRGQKLGVVTVRRDGQVVGHVGLFATQDVAASAEETAVSSPSARPEKLEKSVQTSLLNELREALLRAAAS